MSGRRENVGGLLVHLDSPDEKDTGCPVRILHQPLVLVPVVRHGRGLL
jgi:hypothetical protein